MSILFIGPYSMFMGALVRLNEAAIPGFRCGFHAVTLRPLQSLKLQGLFAEAISSKLQEIQRLARVFKAAFDDRVHDHVPLDNASLAFVKNCTSNFVRY